MTQPTSICLDSNVILALQFRESTAEAVARLLDDVPRLVVCGPVVAELTASMPNAEEWLREYGVEVDWVLGRAVWQRVAEAHAAYVARRYASGGGLARRIVTDYLIGAHAEVSGLPLLTLNPADYSSFTELEVFTVRQE